MGVFVNNLVLEIQKRIEECRLAASRGVILKGAAEGSGARSRNKNPRYRSMISRTKEMAAID